MPGNTGHRALTGALLVLAFSTVLAAQGPPFREPGRGPDLRPPGRPGDIDILGVDLLQSGEPVLGVPFSAEAVTETVQDLADGNRIERRTTSAIARDGRGRTRREQMLPAIGPAAPIPNVRIVTINDPAQRVLYLLDSARKIATRSAAPPPPLRRSGTQAGPPRPSGVGRPEITTETLGTRYVAGIRAEGTRTTTTIPAGVFGNVRPMNIVSERWYAPGAPSGGGVAATGPAHRRDQLPVDQRGTCRTSGRAVPGASRLPRGREAGSRIRTAGTTTRVPATRPLGAGGRRRCGRCRQSARMRQDVCGLREALERARDRGRHTNAALEGHLDRAVSPSECRVMFQGGVGISSVDQLEGFLETVQLLGRHDDQGVRTTPPDQQPVLGCCGAADIQAEVVEQGRYETSGCGAALGRGASARTPAGSRWGPGTSDSRHPAAPEANGSGA